MTPLRSSDEIAQNIRDAVCAHRLLPGAQLREVALGTLYGVSRTVVRQTLHVLEREGLVDLKPGRIASVACPTPREAHDVFDLRWAIQQHATHALVARSTARDIAALRAHTRLERAARRAADADAVRRLGAGFHVLATRLAGNELAARTLEQLVARIALILLVYRHDYDAKAESLQADHVRYTDLVAAGDAVGALEVLASHLQAVEASLNVSPRAPASDPHLHRALLIDADAAPPRQAAAQARRGYDPTTAAATPAPKPKLKSNRSTPLVRP